MQAFLLWASFLAVGALPYDQYLPPVDDLHAAPSQLHLFPLNTVNKPLKEIGPPYWWDTSNNPFSHFGCTAGTPGCVGLEPYVVPTGGIPSSHGTLEVAVPQDYRPSQSQHTGNKGLPGNVHGGTNQQYGASYESSQHKPIVPQAGSPHQSGTSLPGNQQHQAVHSVGPSQGHPVVGATPAIHGPQGSPFRPLKIGPSDISNTIGQMGMCSVGHACIHWQLCTRDGFIIFDGSGKIDKSIRAVPPYITQNLEHCGGRMYCCKIPVRGSPLLDSLLKASGQTPSVIRPDVGGPHPGPLPSHQGAPVHSSHPSSVHVQQHALSSTSHISPDQFSQTHGDGSHSLPADPQSTIPQSIGSQLTHSAPLPSHAEAPIVNSHLSASVPHPPSSASHISSDQHSKPYEIDTQKHPDTSPTDSHILSSVPETHHSLSSPSHPSPDQPSKSYGTDTQEYPNLPQSHESILSQTPGSQLPHSESLPSRPETSVDYNSSPAVPETQQHSLSSPSQPTPNQPSEPHGTDTHKLSPGLQPSLSHVVGSSPHQLTVSQHASSGFPSGQQDSHPSSTFELPSGGTHYESAPEIHTGLIIPANGVDFGAPHVDFITEEIVHGIGPSSVPFSHEDAPEIVIIIPDPSGANYEGSGPVPGFELTQGPLSGPEVPIGPIHIDPYEKDLVVDQGFDLTQGPFSGPEVPIGPIHIDPYEKDLVVDQVFDLTQGPFSGPVVPIGPSHIDPHVVDDQGFVGPLEVVPFPDIIQPIGPQIHLAGPVNQYQEELQQVVIIEEVPIRDIGLLIIEEVPIRDIGLIAIEQRPISFPTDGLPSQQFPVPFIATPQKDYPSGLPVPGSSHLIPSDSYDVAQSNNGLASGSHINDKEPGSSIGVPVNEHVLPSHQTPSQDKYSDLPSHSFSLSGSHTPLSPSPGQPASPVGSGDITYEQHSPINQQAQPLDKYSNQAGISPIQHHSSGFPNSASVPSSDSNYERAPSPTHIDSTNPVHGSHFSQQIPTDDKYYDDPGHSVSLGNQGGSASLSSGHYVSQDGFHTGNIQPPIPSQHIPTSQNKYGSAGQSFPTSAQTGDSTIPGSHPSLGTAIQPIGQVQQGGFFTDSSGPGLSVPFSDIPFDIGALDPVFLQQLPTIPFTGQQGPVVRLPSGAIALFTPNGGTSGQLGGNLPNNAGMGGMNMMMLTTYLGTPLIGTGCPASMFCIRELECNLFTGFIIIDASQVPAVIEGQQKVATISCRVQIPGKAQNGICCALPHNLVGPDGKPID